MGNASLLSNSFFLNSLFSIIYGRSEHNASKVEMISSINSYSIGYISLKHLSNSRCLITVQKYSTKENRLLKKRALCKLFFSV